MPPADSATTAGASPTTASTRSRTPSSCATPRRTTAHVPRTHRLHERRQRNRGQLVRAHQPLPGDTFLLGFTTHTGLVAAASDWDMPVEFKRIVPSRPDSFEHLLHDSGLDRFMLALRDATPALACELA